MKKLPGPMLCMGLFIFAFGCREFHDEEFLEFEATTRSQTAGENISYQADVRSTDPTLVGLEGNASIRINDEKVEVRIDVSGVPQNLINPHYSFFNGDCTAQNFTIPNNQETTRSFNISESITTGAMRADLQSLGVPNNLNELQGKSVLVKAFSNFTTIPDNAGTNSIVIACGELTEDTSDDPTQTTTGGTAGGNTGETTGGAVGGATSGAIGGAVGGVTGGSF